MDGKDEADFFGCVIFNNEDFDELALRCDAPIVEFASKPRKNGDNAYNLGVDGFAMVEWVSPGAVRHAIGTDN